MTKIPSPAPHPHLPLALALAPDAKTAAGRPAWYQRSTPQGIGIVNLFSS